MNGNWAGQVTEEEEQKEKEGDGEEIKETRS
jgi:hypothetical protein